MAEEEEVEAARAQIERSRADLVATADDLHDRLSPRQAASRQAAKASSRARQLVSMTRRVAIGVPLDQLQQAAARVGDSAGGLGDAASDGLGQAPARLKGTAEGNPIASGIVAFGFGLLAASAFPASSAERQAAASIGGQLAPVKEHLQQAVQDVGGAVRESAQDAAQQVQGKAIDATQALAQQSKTAVTEVAQEGRSAAQEVRQQV